MLTTRPGTLSNDFFVNLLDNSTEWVPSSSSEEIFEGRDRATGSQRWTATAVDLVFGSNSQLRGLAEIYGSADGEARFLRASPMRSAR
ncbi:MAG: hypothetical protein R2749_20840 [Acidimicrobiales bacterium]